MATSKESGRSSKRSTFAANSQQRIELNAQIGGIAGAFGKVSELGPPVLALQQALLAGLARSQEVEARRLAKRRGKGDARAAAAAERAAAYAELRAEVEVQATSAGRVAETLQRDDIFSGHVYGADGTPAADHKVRVEVVDVENKRRLRGTAKTAADGYFRMQLAGRGSGDGSGDGSSDGDSDGDDKRKRDEVDEKITRVLSAMVADGENSAAATDTGSDSEAGAEKANASAPPSTRTVRSRAEVLDPAGRVVHQDPDPPTFDAVESEFRIYVLEEKTSTDSTEPKPKPNPKTNPKTRRKGG